MNDNGTTGWVKLYHPRGPQVTIPIDHREPAAMLSAVSGYLDAGWLVREPGLEDGERKDLVWQFVRSATDEGVPIIDCYDDNPAHQWATKPRVYLNDPQMIAEFEQASGLDLLDMPMWDGAAAITRSDKVKKYFCRASHAVGMISRPNPKHNPDAPTPKEQKASRLFVRWDGIAATPTPAAAQEPAQKPASAPKPAGSGQSASQGEISAWQAYLKEVRQAILQSPAAGLLSPDRWCAKVQAKVAELNRGELPELWEQRVYVAWFLRAFALTTNRDRYDVLDGDMLQARIAGYLTEDAIEYLTKEAQTHLDRLESVTEGAIE